MEQAKQQESRRIARIFLYAFLLNLLLAGVKAILAVTSDSLAVTAGAIDSATDSVASLAVYLGIRLSNRSTESFPLGLYKVENLLSIIIALFIFLTGYELTRQVILGSQAIPAISATVLFGMAAVTVAIFLFGRYALAVGRKTGSPTLIAEGRHRQADVFANLVVLVAVLLQYFQIDMIFFGLSLDRWAAILVLFFIIYTGWELLKDGMRVLLDASVDHETLSTTRELIMEEPTVVKINSLIGRNAGRFVFLQADIVLRTDDLKKAHQISDRLEEKVKNHLAGVEQILFHYEPWSPRHLWCAIPLQDNCAEISTHFGGAGYFALFRQLLQNGEVEKQKIVANPYQDLERGRGLRVAEWLVEQKIDKLFVKESIKGKGPAYVLDDAGVKIATIEYDHLEEVDWQDLNRQEAK